MDEGGGREKEGRKEGRYPWISIVVEDDHFCKNPCLVFE
jgi:hypothetical protein